MKLVLLVLALVIVYLLTRSESFQEDGDFVEQKTQISPNQNQTFITLTQQRLRDELGLCGYCIETNKIQKFGKSNDPSAYIIKARYMFLIFSTYPYGLAVDVEIQNDKVTKFSTQPVDDSSSGPFVAYTDEVAHEFLSYDQLAQKPSPILLDDTQK